MSWRVALSLNVLLHQINEHAPNRDKRSDGSIGDTNHRNRTSDHNPWILDPPGPNVVSARDFTHSPATGCDIGEIFEAIRLSKDRRVKYMIFDWQICSSYPAHGYAAWEWRPYTGPNGHRTHGHMSVQPSKFLYDDPSLWQIGEEMVDRNTKLDPLAVLEGDFKAMLEAGVYTKDTHPGAIVTADTLAAFLNRHHSRVTKKAIAKAVAAGGAGGATVATVIAEIVNRLS